MLSGPDLPSHTPPAWRRPLRRAFPFLGSVRDAGDEFGAADHLHGGAGETDVEAGLAGEEDLVAGLDAAGLGADSGDDPRLAAGLRARGDDQPVAGLRLLVARLDHDVVVERLERDGGMLRFVEHV